MSLMLDDQVSEKVPTPGVYHSSNAKVYFGGREILRVSDALIRVSRNLATYPEVGSRYAIPYYRQLTVSGSYRKAFANLFEFAMAIGLPVSDPKFTPGVVYAGDGGLFDTSSPMSSIQDILITKGKRLGHDNEAGIEFDRPINHYPIKTTAEFEINSDNMVSVPVYNQSITDPQTNADAAKAQGEAWKQRIIAYGILIDVAQLSMGGGGDLITSGPIDWIGETWRMKSEVEA